MLEEQLHCFHKHFCQPLLAMLPRWIAGNTSPILAGLDRFKVDYVDCDKSCDINTYIYIYMYIYYIIIMNTHLCAMTMIRFCTC